MLEKSKDIGALTEVQSIDTEKLAAVFRKNLAWIVIIFIAANLTSYLTIRYTKDLFESESEMKLDIKRDASDLGIKTYIEDQNMNLVSGEIEQIKSKLFFNKVLDSLDLSVSYYSLGKVLTDEMYKRSPFAVTTIKINSAHFDQSISFDFQDNNRFALKLGDAGPTVTGTLNKPTEFNGTIFIISKTIFFTENDGNNYFFVLNSRKSLIDYLSKNIQVDPLNFNANTIRVSFRDHNALKAFDIVNKIDSLYIIYSNQQKNLANKQKIDWLNNELAQVEEKMEGYEDYFERFTLQNKSSDLTLDLKNTITAINGVDSQRYNYNKKLIELNLLIDHIAAEDFTNASRPTRSFPESINQRIEELYKQARERDKLGLAYNENTFAFRQKAKEVSLLKDELFGQLSTLKKEWLADMAELSRKKERLEREFAEMPDKNTQFSKNQRYYKLYEEFYLTMMQSKAEFEIAQAGSTPDFKILSPATLPTTPISPSKVMVLGIGLCGRYCAEYFLYRVSLRTQ
jgi:tyrosine-protein kinase Etk/Wzc